MAAFAAMLQAFITVLGMFAFQKWGYFVCWASIGIHLYCVQGESNGRKDVIKERS